MKLFGFDISIGKAKEKALSSPMQARGGWLPVIRESYAGAWQHNVEVDNTAALTYFAVFSCMTLIASDIAKLRLKLMKRGADGIWFEQDSPAYSPVIRKPNAYQNRIQFWEHWILSKLSTGNTYVLKRRDERHVVVGMHILDPRRVQVLVSEDGEVFYQLSTDNMTGVKSQITVPSTEIIHDRMNTLFHPLVGLSPLVAAGLSAQLGLNIQSQSASFFGNRSLPAGILTAPASIPNETAQRIKETWEEAYSGRNSGKVAVLGDGLKFEGINVSADEAQLIEQLKWTADIVCSVFHVPPYKIGIGAQPSYNNIQALNVEYYSQALQVLIESAELSIDEGLKFSPDIGVEFDLDGLLRMDTQSQVGAVKEAVGAGIMSPNEARRRLELPPVKGGQTPYLQQQNYSLSALDERDKMNPLAQPPAPPPTDDPEPEDDKPEDEEVEEDEDEVDEEAEKVLTDYLISRGVANAE